ncbi:hypothetical protein PLICRDRAFT_111590 [Plicaturopsis crispa FD-325 SS-3]|nr:hypothetical protein PLICRDRAFT_111590 [Plicaturopsis crispa FD-325 SS-3]
MTSNQQLSLARTHRGGTSLQKRQPLPGFLQKLYEMVNDPSNDDVIRWSDSGDSFYVLDQQRLANEVLGNWFKHKNFTSFVRQLNMYGFHKITHLRQGALKSDTEAEYSQFENPNFRRGQTDLLYNIQRNKNQPGEDPILDLPETLQLPAPSGGNLSAGQILDINAIVNGISAIKRNQSSIAADLNELKNSNNMLWKEAMSAREKSKKHSDTINRILKFLAGVFGQAQGPVRKDDGRNTPSRVVVPQKSQRLMIEAGPRPKGKGVDLTEVQDEERGSQNRFSRERSPLSLSKCRSLLS